MDDTTTAAPAQLRLAYGKKIHYAPQIVALKEGYFAQQGVAVEPKVVQAGIQAAEALTSGSADAAVMGDAPGIIAAASGMPVRIVAAKTGLSSTALRRAMSHHYYRVQVDEITRSSLENTAGFIADQGIITHVPALSGAIDDTFLQRASEQ